MLKEQLSFNNMITYGIADLILNIGESTFFDNIKK